MKIHILSDIHLERFRYEIPIDIGCHDVIIAAGDIDFRPENAIQFLTSLNKPVIMVAGNHDYWSEIKEHGLPHVDFTARLAHLRKLCAGTQVHLLENDSIVIGNTRFLGCTFWTSYLNGNEQLLMYGLNSMTDFNQIGAQEYLADPVNRKQYLDDIEKFGFRKNMNPRREPNWNLVHFHPVIAYRLHRASVEWLWKQLVQPGNWEHTVVVTHMSPTYLSLSRTGAIGEKALEPQTWTRLDMRYDNESVYRVASYASPCDSLLGEHHGVIDLWIHGHLHRSVDLTAGGVRVLANPRGYARKNETQAGDNKNFDPHLVIDLETQTGYMPLLKAEVDESIAKLEGLLKEIQDLGAHVRNGNHVIRTAVIETYEKRAVAFHDEGRRICRRINDNLISTLYSSRHDDALNYPIKDFMIDSNLCTDKWNRGMKSLSLDNPAKVVKRGQKFIDVLKRVDEIPALMAREAKRKAKLVLAAMKNEGVRAVYLPSRGRHADMTLWFHIEGVFSDDRRTELAGIADRAINPKAPRVWEVRIDWSQE